MAITAAGNDAVSAIIGASAALGGFILVFLGLLVGREATAVCPRPARAAVLYLALPVLLAFLTDMALGVAWLAYGGGHTLFKVVVTLFFFPLLFLAIGGTVIALVFVWYAAKKAEEKKAEEEAGALAERKAR